MGMTFPTVSFGSSAGFSPNTSTPNYDIFPQSSPPPGSTGGGFWEQVAITGIGALGNYFASKEQAKAAKAVAKARQSGATSQFQSVNPAFLQGGPSRALLGIQGGGNVAQQFSVAPYINAAAQYLESGDVPGTTVVDLAQQGYNWLMGGNGNGVSGGIGGIPIARDMSGFYTQTGRARSQVAAQVGDRLTFWTNRGVPKTFSRDATICRNLRKNAGKAYRAAGGRTGKR